MRVYFVEDWGKRTMIMLYMRTLEGHLRLRMGAMGLTTALAEGPAPSAAIPEATELARRVGQKIARFARHLLSETILRTPTTAPILRRPPMAATAEEGGVDHPPPVFCFYRPSCDHRPAD